MDMDIMDQDSLRLDVALPSGRCESVQLLVGDSITELKLAAQESFGQLFLRLSGPNGRLLDPNKSLKRAGQMGAAFVPLHSSQR